MSVDYQSDSCLEKKTVLLDVVIQILNSLVGVFIRIRAKSCLSVVRYMSDLCKLISQFFHDVIPWKTEVLYINDQTMKSSCSFLLDWTIRIHNHTHNTHLKNNSSFDSDDDFCWGCQNVIRNVTQTTTQRQWGRNKTKYLIGRYFLAFFCQTT